MEAGRYNNNPLPRCNTFFLYCQNHGFCYNKHMTTKNTIQKLVMNTFVVLILLYSLDQETNIQCISGSINMEVIL